MKSRTERKKSLLVLTTNELKNRLMLGEAVINEGIKEGAREDSIMNVSEQCDILREVLSDRKGHKNQSNKSGTIVQLKPVKLFSTK